MGCPACALAKLQQQVSLGQNSAETPIGNAWFIGGIAVLAGIGLIMVLRDRPKDPCPELKSKYRKAMLREDPNADRWEAIARSSGCRWPREV